ncbi:hypothetical protein [Proteiniphilum sp.]|uniref:hypothetical protein n=1 Tax=Proteiniphilum sp. TaxID=1926877 RepID=UPI002B216086|nr:hypothetical protein [Proteiniphilum sp.]MEA4917810.1 hypothetical protein [Proteiniphilum sp.]
MRNFHLHKIDRVLNHCFGDTGWIIIFFLGLLLPTTITGRTPTQRHCMGNGNYCAFGQGANIESIFGPGYSSPSYLQLMITGNDSTVSSRMRGTAIWQHYIYKDGEIIAEFTDFVDSQAAVFVRTVNCHAEFSVDLNIVEDTKITIVENFHTSQTEESSSLLIYNDRGLYIYGNYPYPYEQFQHILTKGNATLVKKENRGYSLHITPGKSEIFLMGGASFHECEENIHLVMDNPVASLFNRTKDYWLEYTKRRYDFEKLIPNDLTNRKEIIDQIDNVAIILKTQQATQGAVIAGHAYHLGYVRDQYGVSRGFLAMGYFEEARKILHFYWNIWKDFGYIRNAQAIGVPGIFHQHENDEVEITGYLIIQAFDYLKKTKDTAFVRDIFPMLEWAWLVQKKNLVKGMLPFNGDETYVAGGILPRSTLNDGSAEATLLFIESGSNLLSFIEENQLWNAAAIKSNRAVIESTKAAFHNNFISNNQIMANNPSRMTIEEMPAFRHGFCAGSHGVVETRKDENGNYLCPKCIAEGLTLPRIERKVYFLPSLALTPEYFDSKLISTEILKHNLSLIKENYLRKGQVSSREDSNITIGYEYGFFLYALTKSRDKLAGKIVADMMSVVDETGAWVEYYHNGVPMGCNYRPWESAINIDAIILYSLNYGTDI